jgi:RHS repeat-associated protein
MVGRNKEYRYGYQGQEQDNEIKGEGNSVNYKYRMHDPRVGRFFAVDPLTAEYPHYSPYSFSGNQVIHMIELEGLEPTEPGKYPGEVREAEYISQPGSYYNWWWKTQGLPSNQTPGVWAMGKLLKEGESPKRQVKTPFDTQTSEGLNGNQEKAEYILNSPKIKLATSHESGINDDAFAKNNIQDIANGKLAQNSHYQNAPGKETALTSNMLDAIIKLSENSTLSISEFAGASHSKGSKHYTGMAVDINYVNGIHVRDLTDEQVSDFRQQCLDAGAKVVFDPLHGAKTPKDHKSHFHLQF